MQLSNQVWKKNINVMSDVTFSENKLPTRVTELEPFQLSCVRQSVSQVFNSTENSEVNDVVYDIILLPTCIFEM